MAKQVRDDKIFTGIHLPESFKPIHYDLTVKPNFDDLTFTGSVKIDYEQVSQDSRLVLHAKDIVIKDGSVRGSSPDSAPRDLTEVIYSDQSETATLVFSGDPPERGVLSLNFDGILNDKMRGFYRSSYKSSGTKVVVATTQFAATDARRCFPCWDEPAIRATFVVHLIYEQYLDLNGQRIRRIGLSNMPATSAEPSPNDKLVTMSFEKSPKMSTYLLAFVIGPFEAIEGTDGKRPIRVYTTLGKQEHGRFALEVACKSLSYYEDYFSIGYPLPKMDLIAIPDLSFGAMENWGLVTYRETCLLVDPKNSSTSTRRRVALVVAHELAHQWFGNLVTMKWWTHLWLNEGFASFMQYLCVDRISPEYDIWSHFVIEAYGTALQLDSLHNSHPIEVQVKSPSEISEIFDAISYRKGASVLRMLYNYIGDDCFRRGMKDYLTKFAYQNAVTEDLWDSLEAASNRPVRSLMSGWTSRKGYPWLLVQCSNDGDKTRLTVTQSKFTADGKLPEEDLATTWMIPISVVIGDNPTKTIDLGILDAKTTVLTVEGVGNSWLKLNSGTVGLYRSAYPEALIQRLLPAIRNQNLPPMDRLGLQDDFFALCQAGKVTSVELLKLLEAFRSETNYTVWRSIDFCIGKINALLANTNFQRKFHTYGVNMYKDIYEKLTWSPKTDEKDTEAMTRALVISRLVAFGDKSIIEECERRFKSHQDQSEPIPADLRAAVYHAVSSYCNEADFRNLFDLYRSSQLHEEKNRALFALGSTEDSARLQSVIKFVMSDEVKMQDKVTAFTAIGAANPSMGFESFKDHKEFFREKYGNSHLLSRLVTSLTENFATEEKLREVAEFFESNKFSAAQRTIQQSLETIRLNIDWLARDKTAIETFLSSTS